MQVQSSRATGWRPEATAGFWINRASRTLLRQLDARLRPFGFAMSHLPVLGALARLPALSQRELAEVADVEQATMVETIARMERDDVVRRTPNPADKRANLISLTRRSRLRFPKALAALIDCERQALAGFTDDEQALLQALLRRVVHNLDPTDRSANTDASVCDQPPPARGAP